jgi:glycosyltransferase involved in cell wall biosynthesis
MQPPLLSIVVATWNRSNVLRLAIEAALRSTVTDWEMLVIGDACTDDTAEVVASFGDARIRFHDLAVNHGEQSGPNNEGIRMARGRYVAMLNHDDLWTPDHLATCLEAIECETADLVFTLTLAFDHTDEPFLGGVTGSDRYTPYAFAPASSWLFRRELFDEVGPWRPARTMIAVPSQEWLFRAHRMGKRLLAVPKVTVVAVGSGGRPRSYADREIDFNAAVARALRDDPGFLQAALTRAAARATLPSLGFAVLPHLARAAKNAVRRLIAAAGGNPNTPGLLLRFGGRGAYVDRLRKTRGLSPLPRRTA